jgi:RND family efflux transporter MFP subunit
MRFSEDDPMPSHPLSCVRIAGGLGILLLALAGCNSADQPLAQLPTPKVTVSHPIVREVRDYDNYEGHIAAKDPVDVRARVRGELTKVRFTDGQLVTKDQPLFEIDPRPYKATLDAAKAQRASAEANLELARTQYDRVARLNRTGAANREELDEWRAKQLVAMADRQKADAEIARTQLDLDFCTITAPVAGRISRPLLSAGNLVNAGGVENVLTTIVSVQTVYVYFNVDERSLVRYRRQYAQGGNPPSEDKIAQEKIPVYVAIEGDQKASQEGHIDFVENRVNSSTGTIQVRGILPNPDRLLDNGMRARVSVPVSDPYKALLITERAIGTDQGTRYVYVVDDKNVVRRKDVEPGRVVDDLVQVKSRDLKPTDWIIVNGIQRVRDGSTVEPQKELMPGAPAAAPLADHPKS